MSQYVDENISRNPNFLVIDFCCGQCSDTCTYIPGYNGTMMAYGQTGAGKTFTITGSTENYQERGMIPRALSHLYQTISEMVEHTHTIRASYMEIYNEILTDLLAVEGEEHRTLTISEVSCNLFYFIPEL